MPTIKITHSHRRGGKASRGGLSAEHFLRRVRHVEEAVFVSLMGVDVAQGSGYGCHVGLVHQEEERLARVKLQAPPAMGQRRNSQGLATTLEVVSFKCRAL